MCGWVCGGHYLKCTYLFIALILFQGMHKLDFSASPARAEISTLKCKPATSDSFSCGERELVSACSWIKDAPLLTVSLCSFSSLLLRLMVLPLAALEHTDGWVILVSEMG